MPCPSQSARRSAHSPTLSLPLRHNSFSNPYVALPTSQIILQPFRCITYVTAHSPTFPLFHLRQCSFSKPSVALLCHSSFSNLSLASPTSQLILQPFFHFYVIGTSLTSPGEPPMLNMQCRPTPLMKSFKKYDYLANYC